MRIKQHTFLLVLDGYIYYPPLLQAKAKIMVVRDIERDEIELISKTLGCLPIAHVDHMKPEKLGAAALVEEVEVG